MNVSISKAVILNTIATAPLIHRNWLGVDSRGPHATVGDPKCQGCVVGLTMRQYVKQTMPIFNFAAMMASQFRYGMTRNSAMQSIEAGRFLEALSSYFESFDRSMDETRSLLTEFVNKHFPETVEANIDDEWYQAPKAPKEKPMPIHEWLTKIAPIKKTMPKAKARKREKVLVTI